MGENVFELNPISWTYTFRDYGETKKHFARCKQHWSRSTSFFSFLTLHTVF